MPTGVRAWYDPAPVAEPVMLPLLLLSLAADPPLAVVVKPPELPPALRQRVRELAALPLPPLQLGVQVKGDGVIDTVARPLHLDELAELDRWLALRPGDTGRRTRAAQLAAALDDQPAVARHRAALGGELLLAAARCPGSASRRVALAQWHFNGGRYAEAAAVARQATRLAPTSAEAWTVLGAAVGAVNPAGAFEVLEVAGELAPADWRVPAARVDVLWLQHEARPTASPGSVKSLLSAVELHRQAALRLGGSDPACLRFNALCALKLCKVLWPEVDPASGPRRGMDVLLPAVVHLGDAEPADPRLVMFALTTELGLRSATNDFFPAGPGRTMLTDRLASDARLRVARWLRRCGDEAVRADGPDGAERALTASRLLGMNGRQDRGVEAAERAVTLRPDSPFCEEAVQVALRHAGRPADALRRCYTRPAGRSPAAEALFEVGCLQALGRWADAGRVALAAAERFPTDPEVALAAAGCLLHADTPAGRAAGERHLRRAVDQMAGRTADDPARLRGVSLRVIAHLLAGRQTDADALLSGCERQNCQVLAQDELTVAARPFLWPRTEVVPAGAVSLTPVAR